MRMIAHEEKYMEKCIIAAVAEDGAIGKNNGLLWHLPEDLKYFKEMTMGCPVIMGRRTFESIGRPLPGRLNVVISRTLNMEDERICVFGDLASALNFAEQNDAAQRCFIIGGARLYAESIDIADKLYITRIHAQAPDADSHFPEISPSLWHQDSVSPLHTDPKTGITFTFDVYSRWA